MKPRIAVRAVNGQRTFVCSGEIDGEMTSGEADTPFEAWCRWFYSLGPRCTSRQRRGVMAAFLVEMLERGRLRLVPLDRLTR